MKINFYFVRLGCALLCLTPILAIYATPFPSVAVIDLTLLIFVLFASLNLLLTGYAKNSSLMLFLPFLIYTILIAFFYLPLGTPIFLKSMRIIFYYLFLILFVPIFFESSQAYYYLKLLAIFVGLYLIFQYIGIILGLGYLQGFLPGVPLMREELIDHASKNAGLLFRPRSVLGEPSEIGIVIGLAFFLLVERIVVGQTTLDNEKWFFIFLFVSLILSKSGTGFGLLLFSLLYLFTKRSLLIFGYLLVFLTIVLMLSFQDLLIETFNAVVSRFSIRSGGFSEVFDQSLPTLFWGAGTVGREGMTEWAGGIARLMKFFGLFGLGLFLLPLFFQRMSKLWIFRGLFLLFLCLFTQLPVSNWIILVLPFIFLYRPIKD